MKVEAEEDKCQQYALKGQKLLAQGNTLGLECEILKSPSKGQKIKNIKNFTKKEWILALICLVLVVTQVWLELKMPDYMSEITKLVQTEGSQMKDILVNGGYMLTCALGSLVAAVITGYITSRISSNFSKTIRKKLFNKVEDLAMQEVKQFSTSSLITRTTNDITQIEMLIAMGLQLLIKAPITAIWAITKILNKSWQWSAITAVAVAILMTQ